MDDENNWIEIAQEMVEEEVKAGIIKYCPKCGEKLKEGSISYFEGFHVDSCE